jgi:ABC-type sugar transport system substrate-binding protein
MKTTNFTFFVASLICLINAAKAADRNLIFGVIAKSNNNPVFQVVRVSAEAEAKKLTAEKGVQVTIVGGRRPRKIHRSRRRLSNSS